MVRMLDNRESTSSDFNAIRISIASPEQIIGWSSGEVQKGETINYRTQRPEKDGLFCEKIFGPTKDWECQCGKYKRQKYKGVVCDRCGVEVTRANVRRQRLGHIALAAPVANIWFVKNTPSVMSLVLDLKLSDLTRVLYYSAYVINQVDIDLMREQLERHTHEVDELRGAPIASAEAALQRIADCVGGWELGSRVHEASFIIAESPAAYSRALSEAHESLARLVNAQAADDGDFAGELESLIALAPAAAAAEHAAREVGRLLLADGVVDSADNLALAAIEGDPVAAAISRLHHGSLPIVDALDEQQRHAQAVVAAFNAWRNDPSEEREDDLADAVERLQAEISAVHDELITPALGALAEAIGRIAPQSFDSAVQRRLSDDLVAIHHSLASVEQAVRSWNYRRSEDNPEGRGWNVPAFTALLERLQADSDEIKAVSNLASRTEAIAGITTPEERQETINSCRQQLQVIRDLIASVDSYLLRAVAERRREAVDLIQAMRWLRWDPSQRPRVADLDWLWEDLKLPASARDDEELPDEFYIARSGSAGLHLTTLSTNRYDRLKPFWGEAFDADMGAEPVLEFLKLLDLDLDQERYYTELEMRATSSQIRTKAGKRMRLLETFRRSENRMQDMIMTVLPVLPPELRPMVQLDGGRFATSDLNDLYRRVLSRNHRLKRFASMRAPGLMIRNEKRMLQEAVDSLIDNGRQGKAVKGKRDHALKSLSDLLKGKQGRFRQNLLGKRVDYSGRSVIVVGPELKMDQCGLPKRMALELFKPFVMHRLVLNALAPNIKAAKRMVERSSPEVWPILESVIKERPVMLNRAPTLHRLGIQAFWPVLVEDSAIQLHPLVCSAFNADFDGDQMAVHVPLSAMAVNETGSVMLSINNMLSPASGDPLVAPTLDMVMGCYYLTEEATDAKGAGGVFYDIHEARIAYSDGQINLRAPVTVLSVPGVDGKIETTMGRLIFNEAIPDSLGFKNELMDRGAIKDLTSELYRNLSNEDTARALDRIKEIGFYYATKSGITIAINDIQVSERKQDILESAGQKVAEHEDNFMMGMMTEEEKYERIIDTWTQASDDMQHVVESEMANYGGVAVMAKSGAKGNISQIKQMAGMRGLMSDPEGRIIERPVKSSFREGLTALEYFISTHGARKGLTDTALRTADSGYLTRRLVDVSQEVIVQENDCEFAEPFYVEPRPNDETLTNLPERILGRMAGDVIAHPESGEIIVDRNEMIDEEIADAIRDAGIDRVPVRSPLTCQTRRGICQMCYGRLPATGQVVEIGQAVGVIAAQSIGEPGTQLTMRTFHTGGIAGSDITTGLPRVQELFEVRPPKGVGVLTHIDGIVSVEEDPNGSRRIRVIYDEEERHDYTLPPGAIRLVEPGEPVSEGKLLAVILNTDASIGGEADPGAALVNSNIVHEIRSDFLGEAEVSSDGITVVWREEESRAYDVNAQMTLRVSDGQQVMAGDALVDGPLDLRELLDVRGLEGLQHYLVDEVQEVYRSQGVSIHDKHIEVILRQMLRRVQVETAGDTEFIPGDVVDKFRFQDQNAQVLAEGGEPATAKTLLLGVSKAALTTDSFLSKASFQETTKVLTMAAVASDRDWLRGLKENVIIGRLIPARLESLIEAENAFALREALEDYEQEMMPQWLSGEELPEGLGGPLDLAQGVVDEEIISGTPATPLGEGGGFGDAGFQIRTAEEEDELLKRAQSLTDNDSEIDREVELTVSRVFLPFEEEDEDIPQL
ncbi:MAG: DNA-directed RNA polymerase subunit beta' [Dehalococcoidia bacterium]|nr:DNA-directed RNA polymerase subunit beta' [Dehalococcoidia bacterium]